MGCPNGFHSHHRVQAWPWLQRWQGSYVCHPPDASAHATAVGRVERLKDMVRIAPRESVLDRLMKVRCDGGIGLFVILLSCQEVVTSLVPDVRSNGCLTAHRI